MFCISKILPIFVLNLTVESVKSSALCGDVLVSTNLTDSTGCCTQSGSRCKALLTLSKVGVQQSLFYFKTFFIRQMRASIKNASSEKHSNLQATSAHDTGNLNGKSVTALGNPANTITLSRQAANSRITFSKSLLLRFAKFLEKPKHPEPVKLSGMYIHVTGADGNRYADALMKILNEFVMDESLGYLNAFLQLKAKYEAANLLFCKERKALRGLKVKTALS